MNNINKIYFQEKNKLNFESLKKSKNKLFVRLLDTKWIKK